MMTYEPVIGLEVHVQLKTRTKAFCGCVNEFGARENTHICPVCLGLPGSLPVLNEAVLKKSVKVALAFHCAVRNLTKFDRKHYYYPDLPKNFQISQYDMPLSEHGHLDIEVGGVTKRVGIKRIHLEEDAGKLVHPEGAAYSFVDFNRAGTPLLEIVSEPDLFSPEEAYQYLTDLKLILQYLDISDCDMEKGSLRCDANVSLRPAGEKMLGTKTELKNMNSFKAVKAGLAFEIRRQTKALADGERIVQETRLWDEKKEETLSMRSKEEAHDYRYFPEPDLAPFVFSNDDIEAVEKTLPELPKERSRRLVDVFQISAKDADLMVSAKELADYFEECLALYPQPKKVVNWLMGPVFSEMNAKGVPISGLGLAPSDLTKLIQRVEDNTVSSLVAKDVLKEMIATSKGADAIIAEKNLAQVSGGDVLGGIIEEVIAAHQKSVEDFKAGKDNALMFLVGQVMKRSQGRANPKVAKDMLAERLKRC